jgi:hypothetical protein
MAHPLPKFALNPKKPDHSIHFKTMNNSSDSESPSIPEQVSTIADGVLVYD